MTPKNDTLNKGATIMSGGAAIFLAYSVVYFLRTFSGNGFEIGVPTLNGVTPADLDALNPAIMEFARAEGYKFLTINTRSNSQEHIDNQMGFAKNVQENYPGDISYITTFSMENFEDPLWARRWSAQSGKISKRELLGLKSGRILA